MKFIKNKYIIFTSIIVGEIILIILISRILNISTENTLLGLIVADVFFITIIIMLISMVKSLQNKHISAMFFVYFILLILVITLVFNNIFFFTVIYNKAL